MPKMDGVSATSLIRRFDHMTPIISMTSNSKPNEIMTYYSSGEFFRAHLVIDTNGLCRYERYPAQAVFERGAIRDARGERRRLCKATWR
jgi:CheY-like chemotaxis protein